MASKICLVSIKSRFVLHANSIKHSFSIESGKEKHKQQQFVRQCDLFFSRANFDCDLQCYGFFFLCVSFYPFCYCHSLERYSEFSNDLQCAEPASEIVFDKPRLGSARFNSNSIQFNSIVGELFSCSL